MKYLLIGWLSCQLYDSATTTIALKNSNVKESNPLMRDGRSITLKASVNVGLLILHFKGTHKKVPIKDRKIIPVGMMIEGCGAGILNTKVIMK